MIAIVLGAAIIVLYVYALRALRARHSTRPTASLTVVRYLTMTNWGPCAFVAGVAIMTAAVLPAIDAMADRSFAVHMAQHIALTLVGPPLILLGAPLLLLVAVPPPRVARRISHVLNSPIAHAVFAPVTAWLVFVGVLWGVHFSPLYNAALTNEPLHVFEHILFVGAAFLFWLPVVQVGFVPRPVSFPARMLYLFLALPQGAFLGLALYASRHPMYVHYTQSLGSLALADQQNGGAVMWIAGGFLLFIAFMLTAGAWAYTDHDRIELRERIT